MNEYLKVAIEAAREAGAVLRAEFYRPKQISYKGEVDIVTESDRRSEALIVARLREHFPSHAIIAEEGGGAAASGAKYCWHVDPLDGTTNFAHGYPCFCVSMGLARNNELVLGVIYSPVYDELFTAQRGEGAHFNGKRIRCSRIDSLKNSLLCTGFPNHKRHAHPNIYYYWDFTLKSHGVRRDGSAALDLAYVAAGRFDGFWEFGLMPWDSAAGVVLVEEAGGTISDLEGRPYTLGGKSILASNGLIHAEMKQVAAEIAKRSMPPL